MKIPPIHQWTNDDWEIISVACGIVGKNKIKKNVVYVCKGGKLVEYKP